MTPPAFPAKPSVEPIPTSRGGSLARGSVGDARSIEIGGWRKVVLKYVPGGEFWMGSPKGEKDRDADEDQVRVILSSHYWMGETEVTQAQWEAVMGSNRSFYKGANLPVEQVSWEDAQEFVRKLNAKGGPAAGWKWSLPSEAQWERACRGGTETAFSFGNSLDSTQANFAGKSSKGSYLEQTTPVKSYAANAYGLYDMHGNVEEWCEDRYGEKLSGGIDPTGTETGFDRVRRGGSWGSWSSKGADGRLCRSANRHRYAPDYQFRTLGFRLAAVPAEQR